MTSFAICRTLRPGSPRRGISFIEFLGCFSALVGGVALGAIYLGVDLKHATIVGLHEVGLLDTGGEAKQCEPTPTSTVDDENEETVKNATSAPSVATQTPAPSVAASEPATPPPATFSGPAAGLANRIMAPEDLIQLTDDQRRVLTFAYWDALAACMVEEQQNRSASVGDPSDWQLFDYLESRRAGHAKAAQQITALKLRGVDSHLTAYGVRALAWHRDGEQLFARVLNLLTDAPTAQLSGPFAQSWQSASTQHRMEEQLLRQKHAAVEAYLQRLRASGPPTASQAAANLP